jgi:hypothetical protein
MEIGLDQVFSIRIDFGERLRFDGRPQGGGRGFTPIVGGTVSGSRLNGRVVPGSGGDWPEFRPDGVVVFHAHYMLAAEDGNLIYMRNHGFAHATPAIQSRIDAGEDIDPAENYFRLSPTFETAAGPHDWLTRTLFVGYGEKTARYSLFHYYAVR